MIIEQLNELVVKEQKEYDDLLRQRALLQTQELIPQMDEFLLIQKARLDYAIEQRQDLIDNPERRYWQPGTRLHPENTQFTHLPYKPFPRCKPDLDMALNAITSDCGTDIRRMIEGYGGAKVWMTMKFRYEPANPKDNEKKTNRDIRF